MEEAVGEAGGGIAGERGVGGGHRGGPLSAPGEAAEEEQQEKLLINLRLLSFMSPDGRKAEFDCVDREASLQAVGGATGEINTLTSILMRNLHWSILRRPTLTLNGPPLCPVSSKAAGGCVPAG